MTGDARAIAAQSIADREAELARRLAPRATSTTADPVADAQRKVEAEQRRQSQAMSAAIHEWAHGEQR